MSGGCINDLSSYYRDGHARTRHKKGQIRKQALEIGVESENLEVFTLLSKTCLLICPDL